MVDVDGDDLDDRLVDQVGPGESDIRSIAERVDNIRLVKLPTPVLPSEAEIIQIPMYRSIRIQYCAFVRR